MKKYLTVLGLLCLGFWQCTAPEAPQESVEERIQRVENGLTPALRIKGDTQRFTLAERMAHYKVPGVSIALINDGVIEWAKGYGVADDSTKRAVTTETLFQAASISKPVAAMLALQLVDKGMIDLDENVNTYLKSWQVPDNDFTAEEKVNVRRLLSHSAGLTVHGFRGYAEGEAVPSTVQVLNGEEPANSAAILPDTVPGAIWRYSGGGFTVIQQLIEDQMGQPFPELMQAAVLGPIGMTNSTFEQPLPANRHPQASYGYRADGSKVIGNWHTYPEKAAAGLWTTPTDLAKYALEVQQSLRGESNQVLSQAMTEQMLTIQSDDWGLGPGLEGEGDSLIFRHSGGNEGFRCILIAFAEQGKGVAIMTNSDAGSGLAQELLNSISEVYEWGRFEPKEKVLMAIDADLLDELVGKYEFEPGFVLEVTKEEGALTAHQSWDDKRYVLYPEAEDQFFTLDDAEKFVFTRTEDGEVKGMVVMDQFELRRLE